MSWWERQFYKIMGGDVAIGGDLDVTGNADIVGDLIGGTVSADNLTSGRVVLAGTAGKLEDDSDLTFATDTLTAAKLIVTTDSRHGDGSTNYSGFSSTGVQSMVGGARVYRYQWMPAGAVRAAGVSPASEGLNGNGFVVLSFADNQDRWCQANLIVPNDMDRSADSIICIGWSSPTTSKVCIWDVTYLFTAANDTTEAAGTSVTGTAATSSATADGLVITTLATIAGGTIGATDICLHIQIMRDGNNGSDTLGAIAELHGVSFRYVCNSLGTAL